MKNPVCRSLALALGLAWGAAWAQTAASGTTTAEPATTTATANTTATTAAAADTAPAGTSPLLPTAGTAAKRLIASYAGFAGSEANAAALVDGLRSGSSIMLTASNTTSSEAGATTRVNAVTFMPPTKPMGYGNVRIALSLAQAQLAAQGISQPTPQQLQVALTGTGSTTAAGTAAVETPGVLQLRAQGLGWGRVADSLGFKLGAVMNSRQATATTLATSDITTADAPATAKVSAGRTATAGKPVVTAGAATGTATGYGGRGIVSAAGGLMTVGYGQGHAYGRAATAATGVVSAQGVAHGNGAANGNHGKGGKS